MKLMFHLAEHRGLLAGYLALVSLFLIVDPLLDLRGGEGLTHVLTEGVMALITLAGVLAILWDMRQERRHRWQLETRLRDARGDVAHWRSEAQGLLAGLGQAIDRQFQRWGLTPAERDVGVLLLKGLSHKQVAQVRDTSERTVRQQAREVYRKAQVGGRAELSAWFLEDLLLPESAQAHRLAEPTVPEDPGGGGHD
jgi:DNA-binding CsgD family transcriptional regulator